MMETIQIDKKDLETVISTLAEILKELEAMEEYEDLNHYIPSSSNYMQDVYYTLSLCKGYMNSV